MFERLRVIMKKRIRKAQHISYMYKRINELHNEIFNTACDWLGDCKPHIDKMCIAHHDWNNISVKIELYKKYNKRLRLLEY